MSAVWARRLVNLLIGIVVLAVIGHSVEIYDSIAEGKFDMLSLPAKSDTYTVTPFGDWDGYWDARRGDIRVVDHTGFRVLQEGTEYLAMLIVLTCLWLLRGTLISVSKGDVFVERNIIALRRIGWLLLIGGIISIAVGMILQWALLDGIPANEDRVALSSIGSYVPGVANVKLDFRLPVVLVYAAIAFAFSGALRTGMAYREDSESVV